MKTSLKRKQFSVLLYALALGFIFIQCSKNVGPIDRDELVLPDGERSLVIKTSNSKAGETLSNYQLECIKPDGFHIASPTGDTYIITDLVNGKYIITSIKDGYIGQTVEFEVKLPADRTSDYSAELVLKLTKLTPPVVINIETGGEVEAPPIGDSDSGTGSNTATLTVPPNVVTAPAGTEVSFSFTQLPPATTSSNNPSGMKTAAAYGTPTSSIGLYVYFDGVLTYIDISPHTFLVVMDLGFTTALINNGIAARLYAVDNNGDITNEYTDFTQREDGKWEAPISHTGIWQVVENWKATFSTGSYSKTYTSTCSDPLNENFSYSKAYGVEYSARMHIVNRTVTITKVIQEPAALWFTRTAVITVPTKSYVMKMTGGNDIESVSGIPQSALSYSVAYSADECHDSGGHDSGGGN